MKAKWALEVDLPYNRLTGDQPNALTKPPQNSDARLLVVCLSCANFRVVAAMPRSPGSRALCVQHASFNFIPVIAGGMGECNPLAGRRCASVGQLDDGVDNLLLMAGEAG